MLLQLLFFGTKLQPVSRIMVYLSCVLLGEKARGRESVPLLLLCCPTVPFCGVGKDGDLLETREGEIFGRKFLPILFRGGTICLDGMFSKARPKHSP